MQLYLLIRKFKINMKLIVLSVLYLLVNVELYSQNKQSNDYSYNDIAQDKYFKSTKINSIPNISYIDSSAVILEYESVYDVHVSPDPINYPNMAVLTTQKY
jgi:hypothetical protein